MHATQRLGLSSFVFIMELTATFSPPSLAGGETVI